MYDWLFDGISFLTKSDFINNEVLKLIDYTVNFGKMCLKYDQQSEQSGEMYEIDDELFCNLMNEWKTQFEDGSMFLKRFLVGISSNHNHFM